MLAVIFCGVSETARKSPYYVDFEACYMKFASVETISIYLKLTCIPPHLKDEYGCQLDAKYFYYLKCPLRDC